MKSFRLGEWAVCPEEGTASNGDATARLEPKVMALLVYLAEQAGRVVPKEEILAAIWGDVHVTEVVLARGVSEIRRLLGDDARAPRFIETLPKRGYRLIADLEPLEADAVPAVEVRGEDRRPSPVRRWLVPLLLMLAAGLAGLWAWRPAAPHPTSIAVLPFRNLSADSSSDYFTDGVTEDIITALSRIEALNVVSRTSTMTYKDTAKNLREIGRELGVASILEGSVRRQGQEVYIVARLIDATTDRGSWEVDYTRDLAAAFDIPRDVAQGIAGALEVELSPRERRLLDRRSTAEAGAYVLYQQGRGAYQRYQRDANEAAIVLFQQAIELDPAFALAHAGLANAYALRTANHGFGPDQAELAITAAKRALELDPELAEAYKALGIAYAQQGRPRQAREAYHRALDLRPDYPEAIHNSALLFYQLGEWDAAGRWQRRRESLPLPLK